MKTSKLTQFNNLTRRAIDTRRKARTTGLYYCPHCGHHTVDVRNLSDIEGGRKVPIWIITCSNCHKFGFVFREFIKRYVSNAVVKWDRLSIYHHLRDLYKTKVGE